MKKKSKREISAEYIEEFIKAIKLGGKVTCSNISRLPSSRPP